MTESANMSSAAAAPSGVAGASAAPSWRHNGVAAQTVIHSSQLSGDGIVLDAAYTLTGDKVATCSTTGTVQVWACSNTEQEWDLLHVEELPDQATQLTWAHPEHGSVLAIGTANGVQVLQGCVRRSSDHEQQGSSWHISGKLGSGKGAVGALAFAPRQQGLLLAVACQDRPGTAAVQLGGAPAGSSVVLYEAAGIASEQLLWTQLGKIQLPPGAGISRCLCWREAAPGLPPLLVVGHSRGGSIWVYHHTNMQWKEVCAFSGPAGLLALHWAPALGRPQELLAASYGKSVVIYRVSAVLQDSSSAAGLAGEQLMQLEADVMCELDHPAPVWRLEFNLMGNTLGCSLDGMAEVWFWMQQVAGPWRVVSKIKGQQPGGNADTMLD